jgi:hypothetical protein
MYENHQEFLNWAAAYDDGGLDMRSKAKHDEWQMKLCCKHIIVDGSLPLEKNFQNDSKLSISSSLYVDVLECNYKKWVTL